MTIVIALQFFLQLQSHHHENPWIETEENALNGEALHSCCQLRLN